MILFETVIHCGKRPLSKCKMASQYDGSLLLEDSFSEQSDGVSDEEVIRLCSLGE